MNPPIVLLDACTLKDFPASSTDPHGIEVTDPDQFLVRLLTSHRTQVLETLEDMIQTFRTPPKTLQEFLEDLSATVPAFADLASHRFAP